MNGAMRDQLRSIATLREARSYPARRRLMRNLTTSARKEGAKETVFRGTGESTISRGARPSFA
jgi:hypothetical protein